jgi:membrane fusion protein
LTIFAVDSDNNSRPPLFRQVAVDAAAGSQIGEALATHWRGVRIFTAAAFALLGALIAFLASVDYAPSLHVYAYTDARSGLVRLRAPIDGRVIRIEVKEGQSVHQGDVLAVVSRDRVQANGASQHADLRSALDKERQLVDGEIGNARREATETRALLASRISGLRSEKETLESDLQAAEHLLASLKTQSDHFNSLVEKGFVSELQAAQKRDEATMQESRVANVRAGLARVSRDIETSEQERSLVETKMSETISDRQRHASELDRLAVQSDADAGEIVRAPSNGTVFSALMVSGQSVTAGQALFTILPVDQSLVLRVLVPARAAASVRPGTPIRMVFEAYPEEKFGQFAAVIEGVSEAPAMSEDVPHAASVSGPVFIALASWANELHMRDGHALWLKPGMLADAIVPLERRSMLEWLFEPILRGLNESTLPERADSHQPPGAG